MQIGAPAIGRPFVAPVARQPAVEVAQEIADQPDGEASPKKKKRTEQVNSCWYCPIRRNNNAPHSKL